mgnify:CR=1 FL=1
MYYMSSLKWLLVLYYYTMVFAMFQGNYLGNNINKIHVKVELWYNDPNTFELLHHSQIEPSNG